MKILFTIAVIIFIIFVVIKWLGKDTQVLNGSVNEKTDKESDVVDIHTEVMERIKKTLVKRIDCKSVGLDFEKENNNTGRDILADVVKQMRKEDVFKYDKYEGMTNKQIEEESFGERVYELYLESIPVCVLEKENDNEFDPNAIKVMIGMTEDDLKHVGYIPKEYCIEIKKLMNEYRILIGNTVIGGKYKQFPYGGDEMQKGQTPFGLKLSVSFWND